MANTNPTKDKSLDCMMTAILCEHASMDCNDWRLGCVGQSECLCLKHSMCCMAGAPAKTLGCDTVVRRGELCKIGLYCCEYSLITPRVLCGRAGRCCCLYGAGSFPLHQDYVNEPVCAYYFLSCLPNCGCCESPPESAALSYLVDGKPYPGAEPVETTVMDRDEQTEMVGSKGAGYKDVV